MVLRRTDADHPWIYDRCREVYRKPDNCLDLWARGHYKSTIITFAKTIQDILCSYGEGSIPPRELTFGIFSHTRPIATAFATQIKREFEMNELLRTAFPDICWEDPKRDAPKWSNTAFVVKGFSNTREATVEAWGLIDSQPISMHYDRRIYDDVVVVTSVSTPEQIKRATEAWELSINLASSRGTARYIGTKYHMHDTYKVIEQRGAVKVRRHPATHNGQLDGSPVLLDQDTYKEKIRVMGSLTAACQMMQNPKADENLGFSRSDLRFYTVRPDTTKGNWNTYMLIDPANTKGKKSDWTAIGVITVGTDGNYYVLELVRDRLSLTERTDLVMAFHRQYKPNAVGWETYGMQADIEHLKTVQEREQYRFEPIPLGGNKIGKNKRIERLGPLFEEHKIWFPRQQMRTLYDNTRVDVIQMFLEDEFDSWPVSGRYDDVLDMLSRITDPELRIKTPKEAWVLNKSLMNKNASKKYEKWIY